MHERKNIFLDFLNPDLRRAWGIYNSNFSNDFLKELINISVFLTKENCYLPIVFILEDSSTFRTIQSVKEYLVEGYIILPMKLTDNLDKTVSKLFYTYRNVKNNYSLFNDKKNFKEAIEFIEEIYLARTEKKYNTGNLISNGFLTKLDSNDFHWNDILKKYDNKVIKQFQKIPELLIEKGRSVTHGDIINELGTLKFDSYDIHKLLNYEYGQVYMQEFDLVSLYNILHQHSFSPTNRKENKGYNYQTFKRILNTLNLNQFVKNANAPDIIKLRSHSREYHIFIKNYFLIANYYNSNSEIELFMAELISKNKKLKDILSKKLLINNSVSLFVDTLGVFNDSFQEVEFSSPIIMNEEQVKNKTKMLSTEFKIAIFVALKEEEEVAKKVLNLKFNSISGLYEGIVKNIKFEMYSPRKLGRVAAAIETYKYLLNSKDRLPDLLIVAGIAGGFEIKGIKRGDIIVPNSVIDVSNTKKEGKQSDRDKYEIMRFQSFQLFSGLEDYLNSPFFDYDKWTIELREAIIGDPYGNQLPKIVQKPISCCDSVIKDVDWISDVLNINPEITGVEMESGGVCYAASKFKKVEVAVIRGVSDLANPYKADDSWRTFSMQTVANLIKFIDFEFILKK